MIGIYKITCTINNKIYIGSSKNIEFRWKTHISKLNKKSHQNPHLQNSWNKYGSDNFIFEILEECLLENLINREQYWMDNTKCYNRKIGFNNCILADRPLGYKHTKLSRLKMSRIKKEQLKSGLIESNFKKKKLFNHSEKTKEKIRKSKLGSKNPMFGKKLTKEEKIQKGLNMNSVTRWNKGLKLKDDARLEKLRTRLNCTPTNAKKCKLINKNTNEEWVATSLIELGKISPLSYSSIRRLIKNKVGKNIIENYKIIVNES